MAIKVNIEKMKLGFTEEKKEVYVARADRGSVIDTDKLAEEVALDTASRPKHVKMILTAVLDSITKWMEEGHGVRLEGFGTFLPVVKSESGETAEDAKVKKIVTRFIPSRVLSVRANAININTTRSEFETVTDDVVSGGSGNQGGTGSDSGGSGGAGDDNENLFG